MQPGRICSICKIPFFRLSHPDQPPNLFQSAPPGQTCQSYALPYIQQAGGYVQVASDGLCEFCQYATGDQFGRGFSVSYSHIWRDLGIFCGFIAFNYGVVFLATFLWFKGKNPFKGRLMKNKHKDG